MLFVFTDAVINLATCDCFSICRMILHLKEVQWWHTSLFWLFKVNDRRGLCPETFSKLGTFSNFKSFYQIVHINIAFGYDTSQLCFWLISYPKKPETNETTSRKSWKPIIDLPFFGSISSAEKGEEHTNSLKMRAQRLKRGHTFETLS